MPEIPEELLIQSPDHTIRLPKSRIELHVEEGSEGPEEALDVLTDLFEHLGLFDGLGIK